MTLRWHKRERFRIIWAQVLKKQVSEVERRVGPGVCAWAEGEVVGATDCAVGAKVAEPPQGRQGPATEESSIEQQGGNIIAFRESRHPWRHSGLHRCWPCLGEPQPMGASLA